MEQGVFKPKRPLQPNEVCGALTHYYHLNSMGYEMDANIGFRPVCAYQRKPDDRPPFAENPHFKSFQLYKEWDRSLYAQRKMANWIIKAKTFTSRALEPR